MDNFDKLKTKALNLGYLLKIIFLCIIYNIEWITLINSKLKH